MNFAQIVKETKAALKGKKGTDVFLFDMAADEIKKQVSETYGPDWETILEIDRERIANLYADFKIALQVIGATLMDGNEDHDKIIHEMLTHNLAGLREVLIQSFSVELPEVRVISFTAEMVEEGFLEYCRDENGVLCVKPNKNPFNIQIKIVKTPDGPAPKEFRQKWIGCVIPARRLSNTGASEGYNDCYRVPKETAVEALKRYVEFPQKLPIGSPNIFKKTKALFST